MKLKLLSEITYKDIQRSRDPLRELQLDEILLAYKPLARHIARSYIRKYGGGQETLDDLVQSGLTRLWQWLNSTAKTTSPSSFDRAAADTLHYGIQQGGGKGEDWRSTTSYDLRALKPNVDKPLYHPRPQGSLEGVRDKHYDTKEDQEQLANDLEAIDLPRKTKDIAKLYLGIDRHKPYTPTDISRVYGISAQAVGNHIKKALKKLGIDFRHHRANASPP